jgi:hypothetical protein
MDNTSLPIPTPTRKKPSITLYTEDFIEILFQGYQESFTPKDSLLERIPRIKDYMKILARDYPEKLHLEYIYESSRSDIDGNKIMVLWRKAAWKQRETQRNHLRENIRQEHFKQQRLVALTNLVAAAIARRLNFDYKSDQPQILAKTIVVHGKHEMLDALGISREETIDYPITPENIEEWL